MKKYLKESQIVIPALSLCVVATFVSFVVLLLLRMLMMDLTTPVVLLCVFGVASLGLFLRYRKNSHHYYFFGYVDAFPDMDAPLNVLSMENYYGRLATYAQEDGFSEVETTFIKTRQVYHLDLRAKAPNGNVLSISFETSKVTMYDLTTGNTANWEYVEFINKEDNVVTACLAKAVEFSQLPPMED